MRGYKFLDHSGRAPFTGVLWRPGVWVSAGAARPCREGVHACSPAHLSYWLAADLWEVELEGDVAESRHKLVARRGRLVRRVDGYPGAAAALAEVGAWRSRDRAVTAMTAGGDGAAAGRLAEMDVLGDLAGAGAGADEADPAGVALALAADAAHFALHGNQAQSPFVAACSAGHQGAGRDGDQSAYDAGYSAERAFQSAWLTERLGLS